ncbi:hypothetical protein M430DRAFT_35712, partial [Amorphotheca resinae ATCC 22711]
MFFHHRDIPSVSESSFPEAAAAAMLKYGWVVGFIPYVLVARREIQKKIGKKKSDNRRKPPCRAVPCKQSSSAIISSFKLRVYQIYPMVLPCGRYLP